MSTKTKKVCIEVKMAETFRDRIEVLEIFESLFESTEQNRAYHESDAKAYAEQGMDAYAEKQLRRAKNYENVLEILERIASEI